MTILLPSTKWPVARCQRSFAEPPDEFGELVFNLGGEVHLHLINLGELGKCPAAMGAQVVDARHPVNVHGFFFDLGGLPMSQFKETLPKKVALFIGPEGGWSDVDRSAAHETGLQCVDLGKQTLRAETAALIATYIFVHASEPIT